MSWNSSLLAIKGDYASDVQALAQQLSLRLDAPVGQTTWFEATSSSAAGTSIGLVSGWTVLCDPCAFLDVSDPAPPEEGMIWSPAVDRGLRILSREGVALGFILSGASGTYGMTVYRDGALERCRLLQEGATLIDIGEASPEEAAAFGEEADDEMRVFAMLARFGVPFASFESAWFTLYAPQL